MGLALFDPPDKRIVVTLGHLPARQRIQALETAFARAFANGSRVVQLTTTAIMGWWPMTCPAPTA